jgi:hypothetical protein
MMMLKDSELPSSDIVSIKHFFLGRLAYFPGRIGYDVIEFFILRQAIMRIFFKYCVTLPDVWINVRVIKK